MALKTCRSALPSYVTLDGSSICELMHPAVHGNAAQSLAEACVPVGGETKRHRHNITEELYYFMHGEGRMRLDNEEFAVRAGDTVCIAPGQWHSLYNTGTSELRLLCCCSPAYSHTDTELAE